MHDRIQINKIWTEIVEKGDREAYDVFFDHFYPRLYKFSIEFVQSPSGAEEVVSDVIFNLLKNKEKLTSIENISGYLYKSVKNRSLTWLKYYQKRNRQACDLEQFEDYFIEEVIDDHFDESDSELLILLEDVVSKLPKQRQLIFRLIREDGFNIEEVESFLGISGRTIEKHMQLAVRDLCISLKKYLKNQRHHPKVRKLFPRSFQSFFF